MYLATDEGIVRLRGDPSGSLRCQGNGERWHVSHEREREDEHQPHSHEARGERQHTDDANGPLLLDKRQLSYGRL